MTGPRRLTEDDAPVAIPWRITTALDSRAMYGPGVDDACGVAEPAVDRWESGEERPTPDQLRRLSVLTGYPVEFFTRPRLDVGDPGGMWMCRPGCEYVVPDKPVLAPQPGAPFTPDRLL